MKKYLVGGAVRDTLMGKPPADKDYVVVGTTPEEMLALGFQRVGADFPVYLHPETKEEYALARIERKTRAGYHGFAVEFDKEVTLEQDLARRDLTINSMAMDEDGSIVDPFGGIDDLCEKLLRHTSDAFSEDPLRVIRLARFYARYTEFDIAPATIVLAKQLVNSGELDSLSQERFWGEMEKVFDQTGDPTRFFEALHLFGVLEKVAFFKDLFGSANWKFADVIASSIREHVEQELQLRIFVALIAAEDAKQESVVIPTETKKLVNNMRALSRIETTPEGILKFLKSVRAFSQGSGFSDVLKALLMHETSFSILSLFCALKMSHIAASKVTSDEFVHLKGGEIGKAMDEERIIRITAALKILKGN